MEEDTLFFINFIELFSETFGKEARFGPTEAKKLLKASAISIGVLVISSFLNIHLGKFLFKLLLLITDLMQFHVFLESPKATLDFSFITQFLR